MKENKNKIGWLVTAMVLVLLVIDQIIKVYVKTHFCLGESVRVTDWFFIDFVENNGMAWGMSFVAYDSHRCPRLVLASYHQGWHPSQDIHLLGGVGADGCDRQYDRLNVLWVDVLCLLTILCGISSAIWLWLFRVLHGQGGGYVPFPILYLHLA